MNTFLPRNFEIYITINSDSPSIQDFLEAINEFYTLGISYEQKFGFLLSKIQWMNFKTKMLDILTPIRTPRCLKNEVMGFPVKIVQFEEIQKCL